MKRKNIKDEYPARLVLVIKLVEIQLNIHTVHLHVIYQREIYIYMYILKKRAIEDLENLKITQLSWKNISKFTVASGFSQT